MSESPSEQAQGVPGNTTPTWEMELLISGATIFGLLQLPQMLDRAYFKALNLSPQDYASLLMPLWMYSKVAIITLVVTFIAHLCLRGYWVALVGMNSVYPGGIRWENLRLGPLAMERSRRESGSMAASIERADNRATRVFGTGFGFALVMAIPAMIVGTVLLCSMLVDAVAGSGHTLQVFGGVLALLLLPWAIASTLDRRFGARLARDGAGARAIDAVLGVYARMGMGRRSNTLIALFVSHEGRLRAAGTALLIVLPVMTVLMLQLSIARGRLPLGFFVGLDTDDPYSPTGSPAAFYDGPDADRSTVGPWPHVPARVVQGPYLELFIPFIPRLHAPALQAACPEALASTATRLDCLRRLSAIRVDDVDVAVPLEATTDPSTGQPGMLAMIPVQALAPGRHELSLSEPDRDSLDPAKPFRRYRIPFWK